MFGVTGGDKWKLDEEALRRNLDSAVATSTKKVYDYWWRRFEAFCLESSVKPLRASTLTVITFLSCLT